MGGLEVLLLTPLAVSHHLTAKRVEG